MVYPNSNLPSASQPWGREVQKNLTTLNAQFLSERTNNTARDAQLEASYKRLSAAAIVSDAAIVKAQDAIDEITGVTTNIYVPGTTNINGGTIQTGTISASSISAGTLTGFTIQSAASGARVEISGTSIKTYSSTSLVSTIYGDSNGFIIDGLGGNLSIGALGSSLRGGLNDISILSTGIVVSGSTDFMNLTIFNSATEYYGNASFYNPVFATDTLGVSGRLTADERILNIGGYNAVVTNATNMFIASNGAIARTTTTSSREAKENIRPLTFNTDDFISVSPVLFDYKEGIITEGNGNDIIGFIAEDFQDLGFDELITPKESESDYIGLRYDKLYMYLHKVVAMQNERIKLLEGK